MRTRGSWRAVWVVIGLGLIAWVARATPVPDAERVVVLANANDPESVALANYYATKRAVPAANIVALPLSAAEGLTWREFIDTLYDPLQARLVKDGWIDAAAMDLRDALGRRKYAISGHRIAYLVVCRGVPLKVWHDPALSAEVKPYTLNPQFRTNAGAVDAELSLLAQSGYAINAFVPNPLFGKETPGRLELNQVVRVSRLDGPTAADARRLVDQALVAEAQGLIGRAYIDIGGPHAVGDKWLNTTVENLQKMGFEPEVERSGGRFTETARFDAPALYFGWYTGTVDGPFLASDFRFPPGAIALHIHSFSADTVRSATANWVGPLVAKGVTATFGNVTEPYLELTHQPQAVVHVLMKGGTLGEAAYYAVPALSWQAMVIGDPLYRPFAVSVEEQWKNRAMLPASLAPYVAIRMARRAEQAERGDDMVQIAQTAMRDVPSLAGALELARRLEQMGRKDEARRSLDLLGLVKPRTQMDVILVREGARWLREQGDAKRAMALVRRLLEATTPVLPVALRVSVLEEGKRGAEAAHDIVQMNAWQGEITRLTAPPPTAIPPAVTMPSAK